MAQETTPAPTPTPTPTPSAEEQRLEEEKRIKTLQKDIAEADKAIRDAQPKPSATPLTGDATLEEVKIESQLVTYEAMSSLLKKVAKEINKAAPNAENFVIYSSEDVSNLNFYLVSRKAVKEKIEYYTKFYDLLFTKICKETNDVDCTVAPPTNPPLIPKIIGPVSTVIGTLGLLVDAVAFLRSETKIKGVNVYINDDSLNTAIYRKLKEQYKEQYKDRSIQIIFPQNLSVYDDAFDLCFEDSKDDKFKGCPEILSSFVKLSEKHSNGEKILLIYADENRANIEDLNSKISNTNKEISNFDEKILKLKVDSLRAPPQEQAILAKNISLYEDEIVKLRKDVDSNKALLKNHTRLKFLLDALAKHNQKAVGLVDDFSTTKDDGSSKFLSYLRGEKLSKAFSDEKGYWLELKSVTAGGNNRTRKNLIRYIIGAKIDLSGGMILSWKLYNRDGTVRDSDVPQKYEGYKTSQEIKNGN